MMQIVAHRDQTHHMAGYGELYFQNFRRQAALHHSDQLNSTDFERKRILGNPKQSMLARLMLSVKT